MEKNSDEYMLRYFWNTMYICSGDNKYSIHAEKFNFSLFEILAKRILKPNYVNVKFYVVVSILLLKKPTKSFCKKNYKEKCKIARIKSIQYIILNECVRQ